MSNTPRIERPHKHPASVLMGIYYYEHTNYVTRDMAMDAGEPGMEGMAIAGPVEEQEVWEDHEVCLADQTYAYIDQQDRDIAGLVDSLDAVVKNFNRALAGNPIKDAVECIDHAHNLIAKHRKEKPNEKA